MTQNTKPKVQIVAIRNVIVVRKECGHYERMRMTDEAYWLIRCFGTSDLLCAIEIPVFHTPTQLALWDFRLWELKQAGKYNGSCVRYIPRKSARNIKAGIVDTVLGETI